MILGSFFWGYVLTELPGGRLAEMIGGHRVFGHSMLWASVLTLITPCAAFIHYNALVIVRALLGFMLGKLFSFIHLPYGIYLSNWMIVANFIIIIICLFTVICDDIASNQDFR